MACLEARGGHPWCWLAAGGFGRDLGSLEVMFVFAHLSRISVVIGCSNTDLSAHCSSGSSRCQTRATCKVASSLRRPTSSMTRSVSRTDAQSSPRARPHSN